MSERPEGPAVGRVNSWLHGDVGWLELEHPRRRNALDLSMLEELPAALTRLVAEGARCVVLTGAGDRTFCSGYDLAALQRGAGDTWVEDANHPLGRALEALDHLPVPLLVAANGPIIGGGVLLLLAADMVLATPDSWLSIPAARVGVVYPRVGLERLLGRLGRGRAMDLLLTARRLPASEAERWGLVQQLVPLGTLRTTAAELGERIVALSPLSHRGHRRFAVGRSRGLPEAVREAEHLAAARAAHSSEDHAEGLRALRERRPPRFTGR